MDGKAAVRYETLVMVEPQRGQMLPLLAHVVPQLEQVHTDIVAVVDGQGTLVPSNILVVFEPLLAEFTLSNAQLDCGNNGRLKNSSYMRGCRQLRPRREERIKSETQRAQGVFAAPARAGFFIDDFSENGFEQCVFLRGGFAKRVGVRHGCKG